MVFDKKRNYKFIGVLLLATILTGCTSSNDEFTKKEENKEPEVKANCVVTECIKQLETTNTVEEINEIIGFEGEKSEYSEKYTWKLDDKNSIALDNSSTSPILQATIDKSTIANENNDFSVYSDIKKLLDSGKSLTYDEMVESLGGVEGTLAGKTSSSKRYIWVDKNERTFSATFSESEKLKGKCSIISLR